MVQASQIVNEPEQSSGSRGTLRTSALRALVVALIPAIPIAAGFAITAGTVRAGSPKTAGYNPIAPAPPFVSRSPARQGSTVAIVREPTVMRRSAGGPPLAKLGTHTEFGSPQALWVVSRSSGWLGVI